MIQKVYLKTKDQCKVKFVTKLENADRVEIIGLNDDWSNPIEMKKKKDGSFSCEVSLPKNTQHEFKYLVDGTEWRNEPDADSENENDFGGTNSVLTI
jgi:hypothetical protein